MTFLEAKQINKNYAGYQALTDADLVVPAGGVYGLLGPNGAGKTTLIRIINRITAPDSGEVFWEGRPMQASDIASIGYLPEERGLYKKMKVGEQALYLARLKGLSRHDAQQRLKYWFDKFDISSWTNKKLEELSKGMAQKIQFIITVLHEPKLLIFDEPFSGFDPVNVQLLKDEILFLKNQGATVIFSTHNMSSVEEICDEISLINRSRVVLQGRVDELRRRYSKGIYLVRADVPSQPLADSPLYETLSSVEKNGSLTLEIRRNPDVATRDLLADLSSRFEIRAFEEQISSMNDIFIQTVQP